MEKYRENQELLDALRVEKEKLSKAEKMLINNGVKLLKHGTIINEAKKELHRKALELADLKGDSQ